MLMHYSNQNMSKYKQNNADFPLLHSPIHFNKDKLYEISKPMIQDDSNINYLHKHDYLEIGYCIHGNGIFNIDNHLLGFESRDVVVIPAGIYHLASSIHGTESEWIWVYVKENLIDGYKSLHTNLFHWSEEQLLSNEMMKLANEANSELTIMYPKRIDARINILLSELDRIGSSNRGLNVLHNRKGSSLYYKAVEFIQKNYWNGITVEKVSMECNISTSGLYRLFKKESGCSPKTFLDRYRIRTATILLAKKSMNISSIALDIGFGSVSSFNRAFKRETGYTPTEWISNRIS